jgi:hypothetical protein
MNCYKKIITMWLYMFGGFLFLSLLSFLALSSVSSCENAEHLCLFDIKYAFIDK